METMINAVPILGVVGMVIAGWIFFNLSRQSAGSARMVEIATDIQAGAMAFLKVRRSAASASGPRLRSSMNPPELSSRRT